MQSVHNVDNCINADIDYLLKIEYSISNTSINILKGVW